MVLKPQDAGGPNFTIYHFFWGGENALVNWQTKQKIYTVVPECRDLQNRDYHYQIDFLPLRNKVWFSFARESFSCHASAFARRMHDQIKRLRALLLWLWALESNKWLMIHDRRKSQTAHLMDSTNRWYVVQRKQNRVWLWGNNDANACFTRLPCLFVVSYIFSFQSHIAARKLSGCDTAILKLQV